MAGNVRNASVVIQAYPYDATDGREDYLLADHDCCGAARGTFSMLMSVCKPHRVFYHISLNTLDSVAPAHHNYQHVKNVTNKLQTPALQRRTLEERVQV